MMLKPFSLITMLAMALALSVGVVRAEDSLVNQYDPNGNLVSGDGKFYEYNDANQLAKVREKDQAGAVIAEYFYDFSGQRVKKVENGVTSYYLGKDFETRVVSGQAQEDTAHFFVGNERVAKRDTSGTYFYHPDHLGGTNVVTNATGIVVARNSYLPFGEMREGGQEKYSYTGKEKDVATDLYYFESRFNSPELRHFTQADIADPDLSDPQDLNRYAYVGNNPMSYVDPDGYKKKKKAKLSAREKWMIAHGVDPDKDHTHLKKAKKQEKEGKKYTAKAKTKKSSGSNKTAVAKTTGRNNPNPSSGAASNNGRVLGASTQADDTDTMCTLEQIDHSESVGNREYREFADQDTVCSGPAAILNGSPLAVACCAAHDSCYAANYCNETSWYLGMKWAACQNCNAKAFSCVGAALMLMNVGPVDLTSYFIK